MNHGYIEGQFDVFPAEPSSCSDTIAVRGDNSMDRISWALLTGISSIIAIAGNFYIVYRYKTARTWVEYESTPPLGPLWGGILGAITLFLVPCPGLAKWFWVPILIDPGSAYYIFFSINIDYLHIGGFTRERQQADLIRRFGEWEE